MLRKLDSKVRYSYKTNPPYKLQESIQNKDLNVRRRSKKKKNVNEGSILGNWNRQYFFWRRKSKLEK